MKNFLTKIKSYLLMLLPLTLVCILLTAVPAKSRSTSELTLTSEAAKLELTTKKIAYLDSGVDKLMYQRFERDMISTAGLSGDRLVVINSNGGNMEWGQKMIDILEIERSRGTRIVCFVKRNAHSMAFNLLTHCDVRIANPRSIMLVHKIQRINLDDVPRFTAKALRAVADELDRDDEPYRQANSRAMHLSLNDYDLFADFETIWTAETLLQRGYLHGFGTLQ